MDAVLLAGGFGTRLRPLTYTRPKPLLPVAGRPMLEWVLDRLPPEVDHVVVAVNWQAEQLRQHLEKSNRRQKFSVVVEDEPLGTAGAVRNAAEHLEADRLFVLNADILSDMDLGAMLAAHVAGGGLATISLKEVPRAEVSNYGVVDPGPEDDQGRIEVRGFVEKPRDPAIAPSRLINAGAYLLERSLIDEVPPGRLVSMEKEIFPTVLGRGFYGLPFEGAWTDVGDPERLIEASLRLGGDSVSGDIDPSAVVRATVAGGGLHVGRGAVLDHCVLGDDVHIAAGAQLRGCVVGDGERVAANHQQARIWTRPVPEGYPAQQVGNAL